MVSKEDFKKSMGHWASGVTIIGYKDGENFSGLTASSFSSVSMDPFLILFCLNNNSIALDKIKESNSFSVNFLSKEQEELSNFFATPNTDRNSKIKETGFFLKSTGSPLLNHSLSNLDCSLHSVIDAGDHKLILGNVEFVTTDETKKPLVYYFKKYRTID
jgi:3-hydroxy-9,10-secoandrosta-1,3,5(10)-triene-9,17-dione monooxygenase reductase component